MSNAMNWWDNANLTENLFREWFPEADHSVIYKALCDRTSSRTGYASGNPRYRVEEFVGKLKELGFFSFYENVPKTEGATDIPFVHQQRKFAHPRGLLSLESYPKSPEKVSWVVSSVEYDVPLRRLVREWLEPIPREVPKPQVYGFSKEHNQYMVRSLGEIGDNFIEGNYSPEVADQYRRIAMNFSAVDPPGRLVLIEGDPGTGKTRMVRSLISELSNSSKCIVVPPSLMNNLSGPDFTLALLNQRESGRYLTLILEDADDCLIARENNAAAKESLSALLNLSDGIMGSVMNLRVIATTNQEIKAVDRAILRPGRLLERVHIGPLPLDRAAEVFLRLTGRTRVYEAPVPLAQVYEDAR